MLCFICNFANQKQTYKKNLCLRLKFSMQSGFLRLNTKTGEKNMDSIRQQKISKVLQEDLSSLLHKELKHFCEKSLVTVTMVRVTADLGIARVYLSIFATEDKEGILGNFVRNVSEIRYLLGKRVRHQLRHVPELQFYIDDSLDFIERIDKALKS